MRDNNELFIFTASGRKFCFDNPDPKSIIIEDIAHQLALTNRWGGCTSVPMTVAQHSCIVMDLVEGVEMKRLALMHDAPEAYVGDMPRPLKIQSPEFQRFERKAWGAIVKKFKIDIDPDAKLPKMVKDADDLALRMEATKVMPWDAVRYICGPRIPIVHRTASFVWSWQMAERQFLDRFQQLFVMLAGKK